MYGKAGNCRVVRTSIDDVLNEYGVRDMGRARCYARAYRHMVTFGPWMTTAAPNVTFEHIAITMGALDGNCCQSKKGHNWTTTIVISHDSREGERKMRIAVSRESTRQLGAMITRLDEHVGALVAHLRDPNAL